MPKYRGNRKKKTTKPGSEAGDASNPGNAPDYVDEKKARMQAEQEAAQKRVKLLLENYGSMKKADGDREAFLLKVVESIRSHSTGYGPALALGERTKYFGPEHIYGAIMSSGLVDPNWSGEGKGELSREDVADSIFIELLRTINSKLSPRNFGPQRPKQLGARPFLQRLEIAKRVKTGADGQPVLSKKTGKPKKEVVHAPGNLVVLQPPQDGSDVFKVDDSARFIINYEEDAFWQTLKLGAMAVAVFILLLYRVWPMWMRTGIWYVSVTFLIVFFGFVVLRHSLFVVLWVFGVELWLIPGFWEDIYWPLYSLDFAPGRDVVLRLIMATALVFGGYMAYNSDITFDHVLESQQEMVSSLYEGKFLTQGAAEDPFARTIPSIADLEKQLEEEENEDEGGEGAAGGASGAAGESADAGGYWGGEQEGVSPPGTGAHSDGTETADVGPGGDVHASKPGDDNDNDEDEDAALMEEMRRVAEEEASGEEQRYED